MKTVANVWSKLPGVSLLLMEEIVHQLRLVVYPMIYRFHTCQLVQGFFHQQYQGFLFCPLLPRKQIWTPEIPEKSILIVEAGKSPKAKIFRIQPLLFGNATTKVVFPDQTGTTTVRQVSSSMSSWFQKWAMFLLSSHSIGCSAKQLQNKFFFVWVQWPSWCWFLP